MAVVCDAVVESHLMILSKDATTVIKLNIVFCTSLAATLPCTILMKAASANASTLVNYRKLLLYYCTTSLSSITHYLPFQSSSRFKSGDVKVMLCKEQG